jgi:hypothetical protein
MPTYTLDPEVDTYDSFTDAVIGYLADASDSTHVLLPADGLKKYIGLDVPTTPTGELVAVTPYVRFSTQTYSPYVPMQFAIGIASRSGSSWTTRELLALSGANTSAADSSAIAAAQGDISLWSLSDIADAYVYAQWVANTGWIYIEKAWALAYYLPAATVAAPSAPTGTVTTQRPEQTATVSALVESWQGSWLTGVSVEFRIYLDDDVTGSDPPTGVTPVWSETVCADISEYIDGSTATTLAVSTNPDVALDNEGYITFVRVSRDLPGGQELYWSDWELSASAWGVNASQPTAPTSVSTVAYDDDGCVAVLVIVPTTTGYTAASGLVTVERSDDLGVTWESVYGMTDVAYTLGSGEAQVGVDYLAPAGSTTTQYRAHATAEWTSDGVIYTTTWTTVTGVTTQSVYSGWRFAVLDDPDASWSTAPVLAPLVVAEARASQIFEPLDGSLAKVVSGPARGRRGTLTFFATTSAERTAIEALLAQTGPVIMTTGFGDTLCIAFVGEASHTVTGDRDAPATEASIGYAETELA